MKQVKQILVVSLSNIGDIILTFPVLDILKRDFPEASLDVIIGVKGEALLKYHPIFRRVYLYRKSESGLNMLKWMMQLRHNHYDLVVDLRNTAIPFLLSPRYHTPYILKRVPGQHMLKQHLNRLKSIHPFESEAKERFSFPISSQDFISLDNILPYSVLPHQNLSVHRLNLSPRIVTIAPGARAPQKRWPEAEFAQLADQLISQYQVEVVFIGDDQDSQIIQRIKAKMRNISVDLSGRITFSQVGALMQASCLVISNDSAPMHLASYLQVPVAAIFGPTDPVKYGPWSPVSFVIQKKQDCLACQGKRDKLHQCLSKIFAQDVLELIKPVFESYAS